MGPEERLRVVGPDPMTWTEAARAEEGGKERDCMQEKVIQWGRSAGDCCSTGVSKGQGSRGVDGRQVRACMGQSLAIVEALQQYWK